MNTRPILLNTQWTPENNPANAFHAVNPATGKEHPDRYPLSSLETLQAMAQNAATAARKLNRCPPEQIAHFLDQHADNISQRRQEIAQRAHEETGLPITPRLCQTEMDRTVDQLHQAADCVRSRAWMEARIDTDLNLRSSYEPLGAGVLTIGPNNFPLAYNGIAGGDFAAAIAARNPVVAKAHPLHPGTTELLTQCAHDAANAADLPAGSVQMFYHCEPEDGLALIRMPQISAVGFTGSRHAGLAMKQAADETGTPIYLELSSINPMFLLPEALSERANEIADMIADSMLAASGQQCTSPGVIVLPSNADAAHFIQRLSEKLSNAEPQVMLSADGVSGLHDSVKHLQSKGAEPLIGGHPIENAHAKYAHTLLKADADLFLKQSESMQREMFGVAALIVQCEHDHQMIGVAQSLEGNLTATIHRGAQDSDQQRTDELAQTLRLRVGRLIYNAVPTGVSVNAATVHGGPFPTTGHPGFTAVGLPTSIHRFAARRCYDRTPQDALPPELRDANPTGTMPRWINGRYTTDNANGA